MATREAPRSSNGRGVQAEAKTGASSPSNGLEVPVLDRSVVARSRGGFTVIVDESALGCANGTDADCTRFCANDIVPVSR